MAIKLIKACKELNIGMSTAVEFAAKQGKEIQTDPNTRIDDDLYMLMAQAFNKDMALRMLAEKQQQERQERELQQSISVEEEKKKELESKPVIAKPKIVGKIDLDGKKNKQNKPVDQPSSDQEDKSKAEEHKVEEKTEPVETKPQEEKPKTTSVVKEEVAQNTQEKAEEKPQLKEQKTEQKEERREEQKEKQEVKEVKVEHPKDFKKESKTESSTEVFSLGKPVLKNGPKVVGKIDLDSLNQQTHPTKKTKEEKKQMREERRKQQQGGGAAANGEKRKRERIKGGKVDVNNADFKKGGKASKGKKPVKVEVDHEEVQLQIKERSKSRIGNFSKKKTQMANLN